MGEPVGFEVDTDALRGLGTELDGTADRVKEPANRLAEVLASTGRPDSDEMGRLGPADAAELLARLQRELSDDSSRVGACADAYDERDAQEAANLAPGGSP